MVTKIKQKERCIKNVFLVPTFCEVFLALEYNIFVNILSKKIRFLVKKKCLQNKGAV